MQWIDYVLSFFSKILYVDSFKKKFKTKNITFLLKKINHKSNKNWQFIDIRNSILYNENHIEKTTNIPVISSMYKFFIKIEKNKKILIINRHYRSNLNIYKNLKSKGLNVYILKADYDEDIKNNELFKKFIKKTND